MAFFHLPDLDRGAQWVMDLQEEMVHPQSITSHFSKYLLHLSSPSRPLLLSLSSSSCLIVTAYLCWVWKVSMGLTPSEQNFFFPITSSPSSCSSLLVSWPSSFALLPSCLDIPQLLKGSWVVHHNSLLFPLFFSPSPKQFFPLFYPASPSLPHPCSFPYLLSCTTSLNIFLFFCHLFSTLLPSFFMITASLSNFLTSSYSPCSPSLFSLILSHFFSYYPFTLFTITPSVFLPSF